MKEYRLLHIFYIVLAIIVGYLLDLKYDFTSDAQNTASYIATISELTGLTIALTEIFAVKNLVKEIKTNFKNLQSFSEITSLSNNVVQIKFDLLNMKYVHASLKLEELRKIYRQNLTDAQVSDPFHRKNLERLSSIITKVHISTYSSSTLKKGDVFKYIEFLTAFDDSLISLKNNFKDKII